MKRQAFSIAAIAALGVSLAAQSQPPVTPGQPSTKAEGTVLKNKAPVSKELLRVKLPKPQEADLSNGVHLIFLEDRRTPQVNFSMIIDGAGGYYDPADMPGLSGFTATLMREGTTTKTSEQISEQLDRLAASVSVGATISSPFATVNGNGLTNNIDTVLALMADVLMNPSFPQVEIDRYKARTRANLMQQRTLPGFLASERLNKVLYGNHPLARVSATPASLDALTRDKLVEFHKAHYVPDRAVLAVTGDMSFDQVKTKAEAAFAAWKKTGTQIAAQTEAPPLSGPSISLVVRPNSVQTSLRVATHAIERKDPDFFPLTVANRILGGPFGRLFEHLREQKGYTYGANSGFSSSRIRGAWTASTDVRSEVTDPALTDLLAEIKQMRDVPVTAKDLENAKRAIVGSWALLLESPNAILSQYIDRHFYNLPADYYDTYAANIEAVTAADVQRVAQKYWTPERLQIVAVGDLSQVEPALKKLGTVQVFDAEGNPISK
jgi:zinc protease